MKIPFVQNWELQNKIVRMILLIVIGGGMFIFSVFFLIQVLHEESCFRGFLLTSLSQQSRSATPQEKSRTG